MRKKLFCLLLMITMIFSSLAMVETSADTPKKSRGDVNGDQVVDVKDVLNLRKYLTNGGITIDKSQADCNNDGNVDSKDSLVLQRFLAKAGSIYYDTVEDNSPGWHTIEDWESYTTSTVPSNVYSPSSMIACKIKNLSTYSVKNTHDASSTKALGIAPYTQICNPTLCSVPVKVQIDKSKIATATNLRICMNLKDTSGKEAYVCYIGFYSTQGDYYYHKITLESYTSFQYFYFTNKIFSKVGEKSRTYLDNDVVETMTLTKDMIPNIKYLCFWVESSGNSPVYVDNIDYFIGEQGYDSTVEDNSLTKAAVPIDDGKEKYISISFDDGPQLYSPTNTEYMSYYLDLAQQYNAKFSFFVIGTNLGTEDVSVLKRAVDLGSEIQNHTWDHNYLNTYDANSMKKQLTDVDDWLKEKVGVTTTMVRPPMLSVNQTVYDTLDTTCIGGYCANDYSGTSLDYKFEYYKMHMKDGAIALVHEPYITNVKLVQMMLKYFGKQGYEFVSITEMFNIKGVTPAHNKLYNNIG